MEEVELISCNFHSNVLNVTLRMGNRAYFETFERAGANPWDKHSSEDSVLILLQDARTISEMAAKFGCDSEALKDAITRYLELRSFT